MALSLTSAADYALRAMIHLACLPEDRAALRAEIAEAQHIPGSFTAKILRRLVRGGLLDSARGVRGGFSLARPAAEITLLDVVEAIEGPIALTPCAGDADCCRLADGCPASLVWPTVQKTLRDSLAAVTIESLASTPRRNGRVVARREPSRPTLLRAVSE